MTRARIRNLPRRIDAIAGELGGDVPVWCDDESQVPAVPEARHSASPARVVGHFE
jgi:hypothetical protein